MNKLLSKIIALSLSLGLLPQMGSLEAAQKKLDLKKAADSYNKAVSEIYTKQGPEPFAKELQKMGLPANRKEDLDYLKKNLGSNVDLPLARAIDGKIVFEDNTTLDIVSLKDKRISVNGIEIQFNEKDPLEKNIAKIAKALEKADQKHSWLNWINEALLPQAHAELSNFGKWGVIAGIAVIVGILWTSKDKDKDDDQDGYHDDNHKYHSRYRPYGDTDTNSVSAVADTHYDTHVHMAPPGS